MRFCLTLLLSVFCFASLAQTNYVQLGQKLWLGSLLSPVPTSGLLTNLFYDTFDNGETAAPLAATRDAYPGPGIWTNTQTGGADFWVSNRYTMGNTQAVFGALGWTRPPTNLTWGTLRMLAPPVTTAPGLAMVSKVWFEGVNSSTNIANVGFERSTLTGIADGATVFFNGIALDTYNSGSIYKSWSSFDLYTDQEVAIITRPVGNYTFIRGSYRPWFTGAILIYPDWTLVQVSTKTNDATLRPVIDVQSSVGNIDSYRVFQFTDPVWTNQYYLASAAILGQVTNGQGTNMPLNSITEFTWRQGDTSIRTNLIYWRMVNETNGYLVTAQTNRLKIIELIDGAETEKVAAVVAMSSNVVYRLLAKSYQSNLSVTIDAYSAANPGLLNFPIKPDSTNVWAAGTGSNLVVYPTAFTWPTESGITRAKKIWSFGDSKTLMNADSVLPLSGTSVGPNYQYYVCQMLNSNQNTIKYQEMARSGFSGYSSAQLKTVVDSEMSAGFRRGVVPDYVVLNFGINDCLATINATWTNNVTYILDSIHTNYPLAKLIVTQVHTTNTCANLSAIRAGMAGFVTERSPWCIPGPDEAVLMAGANTSDGTHMTKTGCIAFAAELKTIIEANP